MLRNAFLATVAAMTLGTCMGSSVLAQQKARAHVNDSVSVMSLTQELRGPEWGRSEMPGCAMPERACETTFQSGSWSIIRFQAKEGEWRRWFIQSSSSPNFFMSFKSLGECDDGCAGLGPEEWRKLREALISFGVREALPSAFR